MNPLRIYALLEERLTHGAAATATVILTKGSTPREVGAKMVVQGEHCWGTIGGGCGESEVVEVARGMLAAGTTTRQIVRIDLTERAVETSDRICGGIMDVLIETWALGGVDARLPIDSTLSEEAMGVTSGVDAAQQTKPKERIRVVPLGDGPAEIWTSDSLDDCPYPEICGEVFAEGRSRVASVMAEGASGDRFFELLRTARTLVICGAGHIAQPLASMARLLDMRVVVIDDRPEYASAERFRDADAVIARPFDEAIRALDVTDDTLAVLVTRGHRHDELCLRELLETDVRYIGMLGSRRRTRAIFDSLRADGYEPEQLRRVWAPVGLDIGAQSPAEIALSILSEIVAIERSRTTTHEHLRRNPVDP
ncbi:MAG: XdhC family protein [Candidatus Eisenbacteria bacterium]